MSGLNGLPRTASRQATDDRLKKTILETYYEDEFTNFSTAVHVVSVFQDHGLFVAHSKDLVDKFFDDQTGFHATGHLAVFRFPRLLICTTCSSHCHDAEDCTPPQICFRCGRPGHRGEECTSAVRHCFNCSRDPCFSDLTHHIATWPLCRYTYRQIHR